MSAKGESMKEPCEDVVELAAKENQLGEGVRFLGRVGTLRDKYALVFTEEALDRAYKAVKESGKRRKRR